MYRLQELLSASSPLPETVVSTCFDKNTVWVRHNTSGSDFISVVLIRTFPGALSRLICHDLFAMTSLFCFERLVVSTASSLNWINSK